MCSYFELETITPEQYFEMHSFLDWQDFLKSEANKRAQNGGS